MRNTWDQIRADGPHDRLGNWMRDWVSRFGSVTHLIIWVTVAVYFAQLILDQFAHLHIGNYPLVAGIFALSREQLLHGFIWQPLTYMFLHSPTDLLHIIFNLLLLWFFGREVEYFIGPKHFTRLYLLGGLLGAAFWLACMWNSFGYLLGASAAVLACVIAFATLFPEREITLLIFFVLPVTIKAKYLAFIAVALDLIPVLSQANSGVAHLAHLGGAAFGYVYIKHLGYAHTPAWIAFFEGLAGELKPRPKEKPVNISPEDFMRQQIDPILDKISKEGMQSLTRHERKILESAKDLMQKHRR